MLKCDPLSCQKRVLPDLDNASDDDDAPPPRAKKGKNSHQKLFLYGPRPPPRPGQRATYIIDGMWKLPSKGIM